jgi:hypothetical protein
MGHNNQRFALVSMTNKDVYYVSIEQGNNILRLLEHPSSGLFKTGFLRTTDVRSGATVSIAINHVSSVVVKEGASHV